MKEFGFYVVKLREGNKKAGTEASDILTGEVDMTSECYKNLDIEKACEKRISQEIASSKNGFNTFTLDSVETHRYFTVFSEKTSHIDSEIRNYICEHTSAEKVTLKDNSRTEFLRNISFEEVCEEVEKYLGGKDSRRVANFTPRNYQEDLINQMKRILKIHKRCLLNAAMRSGKSFMCLEVCRRLFIKNILILSPFTSARKSFQEVIEEDKAFTGWTFYTKDKLDSIEENSTKNCVFLSFQYFDPKMEKETLKNLLAKIKFDTVIIDETHSTSDTERSQEILKIVNPKYQIHASGTPINDLLDARFAAFETISFDFIDLKKTGEVDFPEFYVNSVTNLDKLNSILRSKDPDLFSKDGNYTFQEIFENEKYLRVFFKWVFNGNIDFAELNHYLMYVPSVKAVKIAVKVLKNLDVPFKVERLDNKGSVYEDFVNKFEYENEKTIIVACDKATTGNTFPKCDGIMIFKNIRSAEKFLQTIFRCMTPNEGKRKAIVYNFDDISEKLAFKEFAKVRAYIKHISKQEALKDILDTIHIRSLRNPDCKNGRFEFFEETWSTYFTKISNLPVSYTDEMENLFTIYPDLNESDKQALKNLKNITTRDSQSTVNVGDDSYQSGETGIGKVTKGVKNPTQTVEVATENREFNESVDTKNEETEIDYEEKIRTLFNHLDWILNSNDIQDVDQLKRFIPEEIENNLVLKNLYIKTIELNEIRLRDFIKDYNLNFENIRKEKDSKKLLDFINHLSKFDKASFDYRTPMNLVEQMVSMCSGLTKNSIVWDPCVGTGNILHYLHYNLGIPKDNLYGTDNNPHFVKLLNILGYKNVTLLDVTDKEQIENYIKNMNMKFDFIIMNPPFGEGNKGTLPNSIINNVKILCDTIICLMPYTYYKVQVEYITNRLCFSKLDSLKFFPGVSCPVLAICKISNEIQNIFSTTDWEIADTPLFKPYKKYQNNHQGCFHGKAHLWYGSNLGDKEHPTKFNIKTLDLYDQDFFSKSLIFGMYWISNGVHTEEGDAVDNYWNHKCSTLIDFRNFIENSNKKPDCNAIIFDTPSQKINCENWRLSSKLYEKLLQDLCENGSSGGLKVLTLIIPHVDWSRPWTDEEILEEIGLPKDFLKDYNNK